MTETVPFNSAASSALALSWQSLHTLVAPALEKFGLGEAEQRSFVAAQMSDQEGSAVTRYVMSEVERDMLSRANRAASRLKVRVAAILSSEEQQTMRRVYPDVELEFTQADKRSHGLAAAARAVDFELLLSYVKPVAGDVVDVGSNYYTNAVRGLKNIHGCCKIGDRRDSQRYVERERWLQRRAAERSDTCNEVIKAFYSDIPPGSIPARGACASKYRCFNAAEDCNYPAKAGICLHSSYDIPVKTLGAIMGAHGMEVLWGTMMHNPKVLREASGNLESLGCHYAIDLENDKINFVFEKDSSYAYEHSYSEYKKYLFDQLIEGTEGVYLYQVVAFRADSITFRVGRLPDGEFFAPPSRTLLSYTTSKCVQLTTVSCNYKYAFTDPRCYDPAVVVCPYEVFDRTMEWAMSVSAQGFSRPKLHAMVRSYSSYFVVNGTKIISKERPDHASFEAIVTALFVLAIKKKYEAASYAGVVIGGMQERRALASGDVCANLARVAGKALWEAVFGGATMLLDDILKFLSSSGADAHMAVGFSEIANYSTFDLKDGFLHYVGTVAAERKLWAKPLDLTGVRGRFGEVPALLPSARTRNRRTAILGRKVLVSYAKEKPLDALFPTWLEDGNETLGMDVDADVLGMAGVLEDLLGRAEADHGEDLAMTPAVVSRLKVYKALLDAKVQTTSVALVDRSEDEDSTGGTVISEAAVPDLSRGSTPESFGLETPPTTPEVSPFKPLELKEEVDDQLRQKNIVEDVPKIFSYFGLSEETIDRGGDATDAAVVEAYVAAMELRQSKVVVPVVEGVVTQSQRAQEANYAIDEFRRYNAFSALAVRDQARRMMNASVGKNGLPLREYCAARTDEKACPNWLRFRRGKFVEALLPKSKSYMVGMRYPSGELVAIFEDDGPPRIDTEDTDLFVCDDFQVYNHDDVARSLEVIGPGVFDQVVPYAELREGVPGCGKTHELVRRWKEGDLIVCACRSTADEIRREIVRLERMTEAEAKKRVRTIDSYLINPNVMNVRNLLVDEALMVHRGALEAVVAFCAKVNRDERATTNFGKMVAFGDVRQIPFINRVSQFHCRMGAMNRFDERSMNRQSRRCPVDACAAVYEDYEADLTTISDVTESLSFRAIAAVAEVKKQPDTVYLTFRQDEKAILEQKGFPSVAERRQVMTVHQAQGRTFKHVVLVRLFPQKVTIYGSKPHCVVAMTRHLETFEYCSVRDDDTISEMVKKGKRAHLYAKIRAN